MTITSGQITAASRHVVTYAAGIATAFAAFHFVTQDQAKALVDGVTQISSGVVTLFGVLMPVAAGVSAYFAQRSASPTQQAASLAENPDVHQIVAAPSIANAVPSTKVVAP